ncbi:MAG: hypothetical protein FJX23_03055 [Alphaproteobacteria bacterium]|nr:hypothetical protein [Alphaproteobacteria bacterium]
MRDPRFSELGRQYINNGSKGHLYCFDVFFNDVLIGSRIIGTRELQQDIVTVGEEEFDILKNGIEACDVWLASKVEG